MTTYQVKQVATRETIEETIAAAMNAVDQTMRDVVTSEVDVLGDASEHILSAGGKRVRPRLLMLGYIAAGGTNLDDAAVPGAAVELMHTASVVHDDINDHGVMRRGRPSVNAIWGRTFALLTGDFLFTCVYRLMASYGSLNPVLSKAATALVEGETLQAWAVKNNEFTSEMYNRIVALKTAALFEAAAEMGAMLADADAEVTKAYKRFGYNVGVAFQIIDDILDIVGDEATLGKTSGIDIQQGRGFASVQEGNGKQDGHGNSGQTSAEDRQDKQHKQDKQDKMEGIKRKMMAGDRMDRARVTAQALVDDAINALDVLPDSPAKQEMIKLAQAVIRRDR
jgi:octaprenyl-diphosphate synthase